MTFYKKPLWISGHSGIPGNDKADLEAKQATQECGNEYHLEFSEFLNAIRCLMKTLKIMRSHSHFC
jgi:hypothetical protein